MGERVTEVRDVFVAGGMPSITYVDRAELKLEGELKSEIQEGYKIICVTGPTKSGKTVLTRHVLGKNSSAVVNGGQVESSPEFWNLLLQSLELPDEETITSGETSAAGLNWLVAAQAKVEAGDSQTFSNKNKSLIINFMRESDLALVVDDFHYMPSTVQKEIVRCLKSEVFEGLTAILIAVPHRAFDAIGVEREMEGRFSHIEIPEWSEDDLSLIAQKGFPILNMEVDYKAQRKFSSESQGSPLLMQRFCNRLCNHYDIISTQREKRNFNPSDDTIENIFSAVAQQFGLPTFEKLSRGPQSRSKRVDRALADGNGALDIYQSVLRAVSNTGPKPKLHYNEIRDELKSLLVEANVPQKNEVTSALGHMSGIAKDDIEGEPVLEWSEDFLYLTDPFLIFYMRWSQRTRK